MVSDEMTRPERVQAAFDVWRKREETGPNATALFEYVETLEAALRAAVPDESVLRQALQLCVDMIVANGLETALSNTLETAREALAASPAVPEEGPVVEQLKWGKYRNGDADAVTLFGEIYTAYAGGSWRVTRNGKAGKFIQAGDDLDAAKAAAQADYERHIRSALVPAPRPDMERELAEARAERDAANDAWRKMKDRAHSAEAERDALAADKARLEEALRAMRKIATWDEDVFVVDCEAACAIADAALSSASIPAPADKLPAHKKFRRDAMLMAMAMDGGDFAGDLDPVDENTVEGLARTLAIVSAAYDWTVGDDGCLAGLVGGDHGYATTSIVVRDAVSAPDKAEARREALEEAAKVAEGDSRSFDHQNALAECRDSDSGFHSGRVAAATAIRAISNPARREGE